MSTHRRDRDRSKARRAPFREPKPRILVVCEGKNTEPQYLNGFKNACRNPRVDIEIPKFQGVPKPLVNEAKRLKKKADTAAKKERDDNLKYDAVWAVFDVDVHPHISEAQQMAQASGIELAISNPSIELWLLLHFRASPGMKDRKVLTSLLKSHVEDYDKHVDYARHYKDGYEKAVTRAKALDKLADAANSPGCNPTTGVHKLTESIRRSS